MNLATTIYILTAQGQPCICSDLDDTIVDYNGNYVKNQFGKPDPKVVEMLREEKAAGRRIIIFTARKNDEHGALEKHLKKYGVPFDKITNIKPPECKAFYDDRAVAKTGNTAADKKKIDDLVRRK